ncbi:glycosyltransferase family 4 protein [Winogradskyella sp. DF17]|uniref:Glycosyltransferase family 4 protein n=1 Tax=Winogradskyella pelagia TaxID=2819984 RepID=A0ABS3T1Q3_9FLAO|nr:glycosyltransferase family 4 protein [Winogradskyella sp. DF17]MBO3116678.1 glycosyltransferase family 4 protein [Winogradskyella sp. DF17]
MTNVLYIGNALQAQGRTVSSIDTLGHYLQEFCEVHIASRQSNKVLRLLDMMATVWRRRKKADVVLIDTYSTTNFYYALLVSQLCRVLNLPYIPILHGGQLEYRLKHHPKKSALIFRYAKKLVAPSPFLKNVFQSYDYKEVLYIPNSIELEIYPFKDREIECVKLFWVRSFSKIYNPTLAIKVLEVLETKGYSAELTMVGPENDGSLQTCKELAKKKNLEVNFTGLMTKTQWIALSKNHNIFINTTTIDNTPVSVIEAMALGLPVVSTNVGGLPYLIKDKFEGLLVTSNDVQAMANAIIQLTKDTDLRRRLITNARTKVEQFDWDAVKPKWQDFLL